MSEYDTDQLTDSVHLAGLFEKTVECGAPAKKTANWIMTETLRILKERELEPQNIGFSPQNLAVLINLTEQKIINSTVAKEVFEVMFETDINPWDYVKEKGLEMVKDEGELCKIIEQVIAENPKSVADYCNGKERAAGYLVGQTMKATRGKADPAGIRKLLEKILIIRQTDNQ